jgi:hypothetical protein
MANVLFAWELGAGLGHIMQFAGLANGLNREGHRVFAALRELRSAAGAFDPAVKLLPAPFRSGLRPAPRVTRSFADILLDTTFENDAMLAGHVAAWRNLYEFVRPDLVVFDHSPTALLAARGLACRRLVLGMGFVVPPGTHPFPAFSGKDEVEAAGLRATEEPILSRANCVLGSLGQPPLEFLGQLYAQVDETFCLTFPELDPYVAYRPSDARVWGAVTASGGAAPRWPPGEGKKVYCYLRGFAALNDLLAFLRERALPTLIFGDIDGPTRERFASETLRFAAERVDPYMVTTECELAIMNSGHGSVASILLAGKPSLQLPLYPEQALNARAVRRMGAGLDASISDGPSISEKLKEVLENPKYGEGAKRFAERHRWFDPIRQRERMLERAENLLRRGAVP